MTALFPPPPPPPPTPTRVDLVWPEGILWPPTLGRPVTPERPAVTTVRWADGTLQFTHDQLTIARSRVGMFERGGPGVEHIALDRIAAAALHGSKLLITFEDGTERALYGIVDRRAVTSALLRRGIPAEVPDWPIASCAE